MSNDADRAVGGLIGRIGRVWGLDLKGGHQLSHALNTTVLRPDLGVVVRIYRPGVGVDRVAALQAARRALDDAELPVVPLLPSSAGRTVEIVDGRAVEVEQYVEHDGRMNTLARLVKGAVLLAGVHDALGSVDLGPAGDTCPYANWISPEDVIPGVRAGVARISSWGDPADRTMIDTALRLADLVSAAEEPLAAERVSQLVHGDFWDDNVYFRDEQPVAVTDLDFLGRRPRIDDLALTLYFADEEMQPDHVDLTVDQRIAALRPIVDAYAVTLINPLTESEWRALPWALARQPLWGIGKWVAELPAEAEAQQHARTTAGALRRATAIVNEADRWQAGLRTNTLT